MYKSRKIWKPKKVDPFINFPVDKLYEICEDLDDMSLANFSRTSKHIQTVCQGEINRRKERRSLLISELVGHWFRCINGETNSIWINESEKNPNVLDITMEEDEEPLFNNMDRDFDYDVLILFHTGEIVKSSENLEFLRSEILRRGYKKLEKYWGLNQKGATYFYTGSFAGIRLHPHTKSDISFAKEKLLEFANEMGLNVNGNESAEELKSLIIEELTKRGQMFSCGEEEEEV